MMLASYLSAFECNCINMKSDSQLGGPAFLETMSSGEHVTVVDEDATTVKDGCRLPRPCKQEVLQVAIRKDDCSNKH